MLILSIEKAIENAAWGLDLSNELSKIKKLLNLGLLIKDLKIEPHYMPLEKAMGLRRPSIKLIMLLLNYGATITKNVRSWANLKINFGEITKELLYHTNLREKALTQPSKELLDEAISHDNPFVVKLIVQHAPELIEASHLECAKKTSPASVPFLNKGLEIVKKLEQFREIGVKNDVPGELIQHIKKLIMHNS